MKPTSPDRAWDVAVIDANGRAAEQARRLRRELERRGLRAKLDVAPPPASPRCPTSRTRTRGGPPTA